MSRIEELIEELCPDGVLYKPLEECTLSIAKIKWKETNDSFQYVDLSSVDRDEKVITETTIIDKSTAPSRAQQVIHKDDVLFGTTRPLLRRFCSVTEEHDGQIASTGYCVLRANTELVLPRWIYHIVGSNDFYAYIEPLQVEGSYPSISDKNVKKYKIPVPPLDVQREIVRVLDHFTLLSAELSAELKARKQQYEYYKGKLLRFGEEVPCRKLRDIASFRNGKGHERDIVADGEYIVVNSKYISTDGAVKKYSNKQICPLYKNDILMVMSDLPNGRALAKCMQVDKNDKYTLNQRIGAFAIKTSDISTRFLLHVLNRNNQLLKYDNGVDQTNLRKDDILDIFIPVPSIEEQERIVTSLDTFNIICNDFAIGLPAEIEARQKQYEYYRDSLLNFREYRHEEY